MKINRNNYEIFFLDYLEGKLDPTVVNELKAFLDDNPDLKEQFYDLRQIKLPKEAEVTFPGKEMLKKVIHSEGNIHKDNYDQYFIGFHEDDLTEKEKAELNSFLQKNPILRQEFDQYQRTFLRPDPSITYAHKHTLKKRSPLWILTNWQYIAIPAAAAILLFILFRIPSEKQAIEKDLYQTALSDPQIDNDEENPHSQNSELPLNDQTPVAAKTSISGEDHLLVKAEEGRTAPYRLNPLVTRALVRDSHNVRNKLKTRDLSQYAGSNDLANANPTNQVSQTSVFKKVLGGLFKNAVEVVQNKIPDVKPKEKVDIWDIAEAGIKGYNAISDNNYGLETYRNQDGKVTSYALKSDERVVLSRNPGE